MIEIIKNPRLQNTGLIFVFSFFIAAMLFKEINVQNVQSLSFLTGFTITSLYLSLSFTKEIIEKYFYLKKIENTTTSKIRSVAIGLTEIYGKVIPIKERYCLNDKEKSVYHSIDIMYYNEKWRSLFKEEYNEKFYLKDETGKILVDVKNAKIDIPSIEYEGHLYEKKGLDKLSGTTLLPKEIRDYLIIHKSELFNNYQRGYFKIVKKVIRENEYIYVLGEVENENNEKIIKKGVQNIFLIKNYEEQEFIPKYKKSLFFKAGVSLICWIIFLTTLTLIVRQI